MENVLNYNEAKELIEKARAQFEADNPPKMFQKVKLEIFCLSVELEDELKRMVTRREISEFSIALSVAPPYQTLEFSTEHDALDVIEKINNFRPRRS